MQISGQINLILYFITTFLMNLFLIATVLVLSVGLVRIFTNIFKTLFQADKTGRDDKSEIGFSIRLFSLVLTFLAAALLMDIVIDVSWESIMQFSAIFVLKLVIDIVHNKLLRKEIDK